MKTYTAIVTVPSEVEVEANSESEAKRLIEEHLIESGQIKPCSPVSIQIVEEGSYRELK